MGTKKPTSLATLRRSIAAAAFLALLSAPLDAASFVQAVNTRVRNHSANSSIDLDVPFSGVAAGNSIIVALQASGSEGEMSCFDPKNGAYALDVASDAGGSSRTAVLSKHAVVALAFGDVITCTYPEFSGASSASAYEFRGLLGAAPLDRTAWSGGSSAGAATSGLTAVTAQADELVFGFFWLSNPTPVQMFTVATSGGNPLELPYAPPFSPTFSAGTQRNFYRFVATTRQYELNGTVAGTGDWRSHVATYRAAPDLCANVNCNDGNVCTVDSCDPATGLCSNAPGNGGTICRASAGQCDVRERCDGFNAACPANGFAAEGTACGDSNDTGDCDHADSCDGFGVCLTNRADDGTACGDTATACEIQDSCQDGLCVDGGFQASGAPCGDPSATECDAPDGCDGSGTCVANLAPDGAECGDDGTDCVHQDTCQGGACRDNGFAVAGTGCGDSTSETCDLPDSCDGSGLCLVNHAASGTACNDDNACSEVDACDGAGGCVGGGPPAEVCGNEIDDDCDGGTDEGCDAVAPVTTLTMASPNPMSVSETTTLTARVDDSATGNARIASASYAVDGGADVSMEASDGAFDESTEDVAKYALSFPETGVYHLCVRGTDASGNTSADDCVYLAVYDPNGAFVTGGGWIHSPEGSYAPDPSLSGKANFGFFARYLKAATRPSGHTQFHFQVANFRFDSSTYDWLVISGAKARLRGTGTVNGSGVYDFELTSWDGQLNGGGGVDRFRIKITNQSNNAVIYDNQMGGNDNADPTTALGGGNIIIHKK